ncbi:MAG TPA: hypothetical protein VJP77_07360, partial [Planctomycetota bacterium]|nr:hypothetical protein [Planctomycetota bacterium]
EATRVLPYPLLCAIYLVVGSASGFVPGLVVDGTLVPLQLDAYLLQTLGAPNQPPLAGSLGLLDGGGSAVCTFTVPPGTAPALAGIVLHHAAVALGPILTVDFASNPVAARLVP